MTAQKMKFSIKGFFTAEASNLFFKERNLFSKERYTSPEERQKVINNLDINIIV